MSVYLTLQKEADAEQGITMNLFTFFRFVQQMLSKNVSLNIDWCMQVYTLIYTYLHTAVVVVCMLFWPLISWIQAFRATFDNWSITILFRCLFYVHRFIIRYQDNWKSFTSFCFIEQNLNWVIFFYTNLTDLNPY